MKKNVIIKLPVLGILLAIAYLPTLRWMIERWSTKDTYYSHGFLVPFVSAFIIWTLRDKLKTIVIKPANIGWAFLIPAIIIHLICVPFEISFASGFALIPILVGVVLIFLGKDYLKQLMFPILFLGFMIPLPEVLIVNLSFRLKIFAAQISTLILNSIGVHAIREGSVIKTAHAVLMVEDPCSGIRSLIALIALGALMAYFSDLSKTKKTILFMVSIPIAVSTNIVRIVALSLASEMYGEKLATGLFHDTMGILVFVLAFCGLALIGKLLE
jgi:exosortase